MTNVRFVRDNSGNIISFAAQGHSGFAASGEDIVCAAISALLQAAVFSLKMLYQPAPEYQISPGALSCSIKEYPSAKQAEVQAVLRHTLLALMNIALAEPQHLNLSISDIPNWQEAFQADNIPTAIQKLLSC